MGCLCCDGRPQLVWMFVEASISAGKCIVCLRGSP